MTNEEAKIALANLKRYMSGGGVIDKETNKAIDMAIDALGKSEPHWIPVTERLPEYGNPVLTWDGQCYLVEKRIPYITDDDGERIYADWWVSDDYDEENSEYYPNLRDGACIAWCELPEPYEGVTE